MPPKVAARKKAGASVAAAEGISTAVTSGESVLPLAVDEGFPDLDIRPERYVVAPELTFYRHSY